jgi:hypothetical protein
MRGLLYLLKAKQHYLVHYKTGVHRLYAYSGRKPAEHLQQTKPYYGACRCSSMHPLYTYVLIVGEQRHTAGMIRKHLIRGHIHLHACSSHEDFSLWQCCRRQSNTTESRGCRSSSPAPFSANQSNTTESRGCRSSSPAPSSANQSNTTESWRCRGSCSSSRRLSAHGPPRADGEP